jgi:O-antigen/teichoic acid export membrane protein
VLLPMLTELRSSNPERYRAELERWSRIFVYVSIVVALLITIVATPLIQILFGSEYTAAAGILKIHVWAGVFMSFRILMSKWIIMEDIIAISLKTQLLGMIANIALNFVLIPAYGGEGAAVATLVGYAMASYIGLKVWPESRPAAAMFEQAFTWPAKLLRGASRKRYE